MREDPYSMPPFKQIEHGVDGWELVIYDSQPDATDPDYGRYVDDTVVEVRVYERVRGDEVDRTVRCLYGN